MNTATKIFFDLLFQVVLAMTDNMLLSFPSFSVDGIGISRMQ